MDAGLLSVMCSYNRVRLGDQPEALYGCENDRTLKQDLKGTMGFGGFVLSDWGATKSTGAVAAGLDVEMPGADFFAHGKLNAAIDDGTLTTEMIDDAAGRVIRALFTLDPSPFDAPNPNTPDDMATSAEHHAIAAQLSVA